MLKLPNVLDVPLKTGGHICFVQGAFQWSHIQSMKAVVRLYVVFDLVTALRQLSVAHGMLIDPSDNSVVLTSHFYMICLTISLQKKNDRSWKHCDHDQKDLNLSIIIHSCKAADIGDSSCDLLEKEYGGEAFDLHAIGKVLVDWAVDLGEDARWVLARQCLSCCIILRLKLLAVATFKRNKWVKSLKKVLVYLPPRCIKLNE